MKSKLKNMSYLLMLFVVLALVIPSCSNEATPITSDGKDFTLDQSLLDFGQTETLKIIKIKFVKPTESYGWKIEKNATNRWIEFNIQGGNTEKDIEVTINRSQIDFGDNYDTLYFHIFPALTEAEKKSGIIQVDSIKKLVIKATRIPNYNEVVSTQVGNAVKFLPNYLKNDYSLTGSICVNYVKDRFRYDDKLKDTTMDCVVYNIDNSNGVFNSNGSFSVILKENGQSLDVPTINFNYYNSAMASIAGTIQKISKPIANATFDDIFYHKFQFTNKNGTFIDSILSVSPISFFPQPPIIQTSATQGIIWEKTPATDDSVFVVMAGVNDTTFRLQSLVVNDDAELVKFTSIQMGQVKKGSSKAIMTIVRFRYKIDAVNKRYILSQSQKSYQVDLN